MADPIHLSHGETLRGYDRWASHYDTDPNPLVAASVWCLDRDPIEGAGAAVIELGCGTGRNVDRVLAAGAAHYLGVDGSAGMLAVAAERHRDPRCAWRQADLASPPRLADATFDLALIVLVLEHLVALDLLLAAVGAALRPGGRLRIIELHPDRIAAGTVAHFSDDGTELRFASTAHPVAAIEAALARAGFAIDAIREHAAGDDLIGAVPRLAKHRGLPVVLDLAAVNGQLRTK